jgi:hypothetical protein
MARRRDQIGFICLPGMPRRAFLATVAGGLLAAPLVVGAQQAGKVWRIGFLGNFSPTPGATFISTGFIDGLRQYGYVEGRNLVIEVRFAQGHEEQYPQLVCELLQANSFRRTWSWC